MPTTMTDLIARVRAEIGDPPQPFRTTALGDGRTQLVRPAQAADHGHHRGRDRQRREPAPTCPTVSAASRGPATTAYTTGTVVTYDNASSRPRSPSTNQTPRPQHLLLDEHHLDSIRDQRHPGPDPARARRAEQRHADHRGLVVVDVLRRRADGLLQRRAQPALLRPQHQGAVPDFLGLHRLPRDPEERRQPPGRSRCRWWSCWPRSTPSGRWPTTPRRTSTSRRPRARRSTGPPSTTRS